MTRAYLFDWEQWGLLKQRSVEGLLGDRAFLVRYGVFWLLLVAFLYVWMALVGMSCCVGPEHSENHFGVGNRVFSVLAILSGVGAFGMGAAAGAGVLVRERVMFVRECGAANLNVAAYLMSKVHSLSLLGIVAVMAYLPFAHGLGNGVNKYLGAVPVGWFAIVLLMTMVCGVCFGLMVSALSRKVWQSRVVVGVFALGMALFSNGSALFTSQAGRFLSGLSPLSWVRASMVAFGAEMQNDVVASGYMLVLGLFSMFFLVIGYVVLKREGYGDSRE